MRCDEGIGYDMVICRELMLQLGLKTELSRQLLEWYETVVPMKDPRNVLDQPDLTKIDMQEVVMQTAETASTIEATGFFAETLERTYAKIY